MSKRKTGLGGGVDSLFETKKETATTQSPQKINASLRLYKTDKESLSTIRAYLQLQGEATTTADIVARALALFKKEIGMDE